MDVYLIVTFIAFIFYVQVSAYVIFALPVSRIHGLLLTIALLFAVFSLSVFFLGHLDNANKTVVFSRLAITSTLFLPVISNYLFYFINDWARPVAGKIVSFLFLPAGIIIAIIYNWAPVSMGVLSRIDSGYAFFFYPVNLSKLIVFIYFLSLVAFAIWQLLQWRNHAILNRSKRQSRIILSAVWLIALSGILLDVVIPSLGHPSFPFLIHIFGVPPVAAMSYSVIGLRKESYSTEVIANLISGSISACIIFFDRWGKVLAANHFARRYLGYGKFEIQELVIKQFFEREDDVDFLAHTSKYNEIRDHLLEIKNKKGANVPVSVSVIRMQDKFWSQGGFILIAHDRKHIARLELAIQKRRDRMFQIVSRNTDLKRILGERTMDISRIKTKLDSESQSISDTDGFFGHAKKEKESLIGEMYHRVKNNMQVVISLIHFMLDDPKLLPSEREKFMAIVHRIRKISSIHDTFYVTPLLAKIDFGSYVRKASEAFHQLHGLERAMVYRVNADDIHLSIQQALPCSIILDELLKNAYTHAFPDDYICKAGGDVTAVVSVYCKYSGDSTVIGVRDNGIGYETSIARDSGNGIGLQLVKDLAEHILGAKFTMQSSFGTCVEICFSTHGDSR